MARKTPSRLELRKQVEAAEAQEAASGKKATKKKAATKTATKKATRRTKEKIPPRKQLIWAVYSGSMKEEARFPYDEREAAEEKVAQLRARSKKLYFIQPLKIAVPNAPAED